MITYMAKARVMEKGYSLKSFFAATRVEAFLRAGAHGSPICWIRPGLRKGVEG